jgi:hypothetical protein
MQGDGLLAIFSREQQNLHRRRIYTVETQARALLLISHTMDRSSSYTGHGYGTVKSAAAVLSHNGLVVQSLGRTFAQVEIPLAGYDTADRLSVFWYPSSYATAAPGDARGTEETIKI